MASGPTIEFKMRLFKATCISILLYGCETWVLTEELKKRLDVFARTCYRIILKIRQADERITNEELLKRVGQVEINETIRIRQLQFIGHCLRMNNNEPAHIFALYKSEVGSNPPGRPPTIYLDQISNYITRNRTRKRKDNLTVNQIAEYAKDKESWRVNVFGERVELHFLVDELLQNLVVIYIYHYRCVLIKYNLIYSLLNIIYLNKIIF